MPKMQIPRKLQPILTTRKRFIVIIGGRGSGKSQSITDIAIMKAQTEKLKIMCCREFQNSLSDSMYSLINSEVERLGVTGVSSTNHSVECDSGGEFIFKGLARNPESIKSMHGVNLAIVEEAQTISETSLKILTPTIREPNSEIWFIGNPRSSEDPFSKRFINPYLSELESNGFYEDDLHLIIVCNWKDNPFFPNELNKERKHDHDHLSRAQYLHVWEGKFLDEVENSIIKPEWFDAAIDAHLKDTLKAAMKPKGAIIVSHDPSDEGSDAGGYVLRHGSIIKDAREFTSGNGNEGCDWATDLAIQANADVFTWDCDGMGALLRKQISDSFLGKKITQEPFKGSHSPDNKNSDYQPANGEARVKSNGETFRNKRAQYYIRLRDRFYNTYLAVEKGQYCDPDTMISISSDINLLDKLRAEVCRIPLKHTGNGLIQIMPKPEMSKLGINSPNLADSVMMSLLEPQVQAVKVKLRFDTIC